MPSVFDLESDLRVLNGRWQMDVDELCCGLESGRLGGNRSDLEGPAAEGNPSHLEALVQTEGQDSRADSRECHSHLAPDLDAAGGRIEDDLQVVDRRSIRVGGRRSQKKRYRSEYASHYGARARILTGSLCHVVAPRRRPRPDRSAAGRGRRGPPSADRAPHHPRPTDLAGRTIVKGMC